MVCVRQDIISPLTADMILSSEVGVMPIPEEKIVLKERLHPGKMLLVDTVAGKVVDDDELKEKYAATTAIWRMAGQQSGSVERYQNSECTYGRIYTGADVHSLQKAFGYTYEEVPYFNQKYGTEWSRRNRCYGY